MPPGAVELAVRHNDSEADTDIIAIHGLDTKSPDTWTWRQGDVSVNWLSDVNMLPSRVGKARILTCDWSADLLQPKDMSQKSVKEYTRLILDGIQRERAEHEDRPIIFIASCLGGIILIQALVMAGSGYSSVCQATRGIVFLSTPFRGTSFKDIAPWAEPALSIWASATGRAVTELTKNTTQSSNLEELLRQFTKLVKDREKESELEPNLKIQLITFYEQQMTKLLHEYLWFSKMKLLVDSDSANLDIVEHPIPLDRTHVLMNKFAGPRDLEYEKVAGRIEDFLRSSRKTFFLDRADAYIKENCEKKLTILRLSGDSLPMNQCYINLAVVEQQGTKTANSAERDAKVSPFSLSHRLSVDTPDKQTQIVLSTIFESRKNRDGTTKTPRRILIRGRAGVGKTTLCKKMVYEFVHEHKWQPLFDRVLWVPLRRLKRWSSASYTFEELFRREVFQNCEEALRYLFVRSLRRALDEDRILFILDGLDEVSQEWARDNDGYDFLRDLLNQKNVVVTSRPYFKLPDGINPMDLELETLGFYPKQVEEYVNTTFGNSGTQKAEEVRLFLQTHPLIQGLVRIPVQLDALCYNWGGSIDLGSKPETMTAMYQAIENGLWKKDAFLLGKIQTENELQSASPKTMERMMEREIGFLESLAFSGLCSDTIEFETRISSTILHNTDDPKNGNPPDKILPRLSFLRTSDPPDSTSGSQQSCHFLHLIYQEYFAARYFVRKWKSGEDLEPFTITDKSGSKRCVRGKGIGTTIFLHQHKARYDILWRFVAGLLDSGDGHSDEQDTLRFFQTIDEKPRDLLGPAHQRLLMHCLGEVSPNLLIRPTLEKNLTSWLLFESSFENASLAREVELPDNVLMAALEDGSNKYNIAVSLNGRPTIPSSIVKLATSWLADDYNDKAALQILDNSHIKLPNITLQALTITVLLDTPQLRP
ncbi:pfs domain containing protein [Grosmannia clavigera kw1407]|uniref:Pfs domain containing protein n=1 Tax=Grosmannia clavigera (strain kw1407 / UAMH 11150) TaxID=655863 RepID=F0XEV0_GROCL|nr:pfs domain containing protein [Grosmannia clavigera kw1407]EFX03859.1 pfs domain containing protein [Grosmannia clavigera kw1407]